MSIPSIMGATANSFLSAAAGCAAVFMRRDLAWKCFTTQLEKPEVECWFPVSASYGDDHREMED
jgi:hypothetical protein